jgi:hypothetical protein
VTAASVLEGPILLDSRSDSDVIGQQLAVAPNGIAVAVWYYSTVNDIWSAVFR